MKLIDDLKVKFVDLTSELDSLLDIINGLEVEKSNLEQKRLDLNKKKETLVKKEAEVNKKSSQINIISDEIDKKQAELKIRNEKIDQKRRKKNYLISVSLLPMINKIRRLQNFM